MDTCACGHVADEHGGDPRYPGSSACQLDGCACIAFDLDDESGEEEGEG